MTTDELIGMLEVFRDEIRDLVETQLVGLIEALRKDPPRPEPHPAPEPPPGPQAA